LIYKLFCFLPYQIVAKNIKSCANNKVNWNVNYLPVRKLSLTHFAALSHDKLKKRRYLLKN